jgi:hypothetical protein
MEVLEMLTVARVVNKFPSFYGTQIFIAGLKTSRDFPHSWVKWTQSNPHTFTLFIIPIDAVTTGALRINLQGLVYT